jgi:hypothetical protein
MNSLPNQSQRNPRRLWPHSSTFVVATLAAAVLLFLNVAGWLGVEEHNWSFGWPILYAQATAYDTQSLFPTGDDPDNDWRAGFVWTHREFLIPVSISALACNVVISVGLALVAAIACEVWRRRRRTCQFTLREAALALTIAGLVCGWMAYVVRTAKSTDDYLIKSRRRLGSTHTIPATPEVVRELLPGEYVKPLDRLDAIWFAREGINFQDASFIGRQTYLRQLTIYGQSLQPGDLTPLGGCRRLESLQLQCKSLSTADLKAISSLSELKIMWLTCHEQPTELMTAVSSLPSLEKFSLSNWVVREGDLEQLSSSPRLKELALYPGQVDDARLVDLSPLAALSTLETLRVCQVRLTPGSLQALRNAPQLGLISLVDCEFNAADIDLLRRTKPRLVVSAQPRRPSSSSD